MIFPFQTRMMLVLICIFLSHTQDCTHSGKPKHIQTLVYKYTCKHRSKDQLYFVYTEEAILAGIIKEKARVVAMDFRGHGESSSENDFDLSIETMCNDVLAVIKTMFGDSPPAIVLVGHSML